MKVKMITTACGPDGVQLAGNEYDLPEKFARDLVAGQFGKWVGEPPADPIPEVLPEKKKASPVKETAVLNRPKETADKPI